MSQQLHLPVSETSQVAEARRAVTALAGSLGFNETETGKIALIVTEAATNLVKHAGGGDLLARPLAGAEQLGLEILALDEGPGLADVGQALNDGYSTAGSPGTGLGAVIRLSTVFDIYSLPAKGTSVLAQVWRQAKPGRPASGIQGAGNGISLVEVGAVCLAKAGQDVSGDNWAIAQDGHRYLVMVADGLGHGAAAAAASQAAVEVLSAKPALGPVAILEAAHAALYHTRGAAVAVVELDLARLVVKAAGVGNIAGAILATGAPQHLTSYNGIVGHQVQKFQEFSYPWPDNALLVLHSDGLTSHWNLDAYPGLITRHPSLIAGVLYRDFSRGSDDVSVVVVKQK
ncbi:MAG: SpoIIE family protein phosphatase [Anaerolineae bacterium]|nr:SpoIIE family protein phosphatase [Anaerolineae bacterium]